MRTERVRARPVHVGVLLAVVLLGARPAPAADAPWERLIVDLAAADAQVRTAAARRAGSAWPDGARAAVVLAEVAAEDADAGVRAAAAEAVATLAQQGLTAWAQFLAGASGTKQKDFHEVAGEIVRLGSKISVVDFCAGLGYSDADAAQSAILGALPLMWASRSTRQAPDVLGLDLVLLDRAARGGPKTRPMALAGLALLASAMLRDHGLAPAAAGGAPHSSVPALLALLDDPRLWIPPLATCLLGSAAPVGPAGGKDPVALALAGRLETLAAAPLPDDARPLDRLRSLAGADPLITAVRRLGPAAAAAAPSLRRLRKRGARGVVEALVRIGSTDSPFAEEPASLERYVEQRPDDAFGDAEHLREFLRTVEALTRVDPAQARAARPAVWAIARTAFTGEERREGPSLGGMALQLLPLLGPLGEGEQRLLGALAEDPSGPVAYTVTVTLGRAGRDPARALTTLLEASRRKDGAPYFVVADRMLGDLRLVARAAVAAADADPAALLGSLEAPSPVVRGALEGLAAVPARAAAAAPWIGLMLAGTAPHLTPLNDGTLLKVVVSMPRPLDAPDPTVLPAVEARRLAVRALTVAGAAALPHKALLEGLRKDPDVVLRWRVEQALRALPAR